MWCVLSLLSLLPSVGFAASAVPNFLIGGVPPAGFPHFENPASITLTKSGTGSSASYLLTSANTSGDFIFQYNSTSAYNVTGTYNLTASFNAAGVFTGGSLAINGTLPGYNGPGTAPSATSQNLFSANLVSFGYDIVPDITPVALGFKTENFSGWATQFSDGSAESAYLYNFNVPGLMNMFANPKFKTITFQGAALTTVPIPAAVWLFGSGLALISCVRRNKPHSNLGSRDENNEA
jgi:hypothetical protein